MYQTTLSGFILYFKNLLLDLWLLWCKKDIPSERKTFEIKKGHFFAFNVLWMVMIIIMGYWDVEMLVLYLYVAIFFGWFLQVCFQYGFKEALFIEVGKLKNIQLQFMNTDKYERILLLQSYYEQLTYLESLERKVGIKNVYKNNRRKYDIIDRMRVFQKYCWECERSLHELDKNKMENQKYFLAYSDIQLSSNQENYFSTKDSESRFLSLSSLIKNITVIKDNRSFTWIVWLFLYFFLSLGAMGLEVENQYMWFVILTIISICLWIIHVMTSVESIMKIKAWQTLWFFWSTYATGLFIFKAWIQNQYFGIFFLVCLVTSYVILIIISYVQKFQIKAIYKNYIELKDKVHLLKNSSISFVSHIDVLKLLIQSEQWVKWIEPVMVDQISFYINRIMIQWNTYNKIIDNILYCAKKRFYLVIPINPYGYIEQTIISEREKWRQDFLSIQATIKSWITTHMKDLQNHQQEIHQIHQSLLQNKNENAEVITLLEKNFNLHLQSAQKVENSI